MKTTSLFGLFLLSTLLSHPSTTAQILDIEGDPLENGGSYYLLPTIFAKGGGIELVKTEGETCPLTVVQSPSEVNEGLPIKISSPIRSRFISEGTKVQIGFAYPPPCAPSPWWTIVVGSQQGAAVKLSGHGRTLKGSFKIVQGPSKLNVYKLMFCPEDFGDCVDIGTRTDEERNRRLVITEDNPLEVGFIKVDYSSSDE